MTLLVICFRTDWRDFLDEFIWDSLRETSLSCSMHPAWLVVRDFLFSSFIIVLLFMQLYEESGNSLDFKVFTSEIFVEFIECLHDISHHLWHFWYLSYKFCNSSIMKSSFFSEIDERISHELFLIFCIKFRMISKKIMQNTYISSFCE